MRIKKKLKMSMTIFSSMRSDSVEWKTDEQIENREENKWKGCVSLATLVCFMQAKIFVNIKALKSTFTRYINATLFDRYITPHLNTVAIVLMVYSISTECYLWRTSNTFFYWKGIQMNENSAKCARFIHTWHTGKYFLISWFLPQKIAFQCICSICER